MAPGLLGTRAFGYVIEEHLIQSQRGKKSGNEFVFGFDVPPQNVCIADMGDFKSGFIQFRPELPVSPGKTEVLCDYPFFEVIQACASG